MKIESNIIGDEMELTVEVGSVVVDEWVTQTEMLLLAYNLIDIADDLLIRHKSPTEKLESMTSDLMEALDMHERTH